MSKVSAKGLDQGQHSDITNNNDFENDDLVEFQHDSKTINFYYSQLTKYSKHIRDEYLFSDVIDRFPQDIHNFQEEYQLLPESIDYFFQLLQKNYNIEEDLILTYIQCIDLLKISKFLEIRKLSFNLNQYIKSHNIEVDFIIQMIEYEVKTQKETNNYDIIISNEVESILIDKINECFTNEKFKRLPIQIIYRVIKQCPTDSIDSDKLFDIIIISLSKFCVLFTFLDLQKLSDDHLEELCRMYSKSNENTQNCYDYLKCNLNLINEINDRKKNLEQMSVEQQNKLSDLENLVQKQVSESEKVNSQLQGQLDESKKLITEQQDKVKDLESKIELLQNRYNDSEKANSKLQSLLDDSKEKNEEQKDKVKDLESKIELLQNQVNDSNNVNAKQLNKMEALEKLVTQLQNKFENSVKEHKKQSLIEGQIVARVEKGLMINAEINLKSESGTLDTSKSKVIVSTSDVKSLGIEAYEKGETITSLHMKTTFARASGTYYVRCIAFNSNGESNEIVSNPVTTILSSFTFDYEGQKTPAVISLPRGEYKLEVWGAKGGDSTGNGVDIWDGHRGSQTPKGGLGGYSRGILSLAKNETVYVYVGEEGKPSNSSDGSTTEGGFPDGGGTRTGHTSGHTAVPGTGGGSTSIRIGSKSDNNRVIVAGGGGGAGGSSCHVDPGGFGGGQNGGNCSYRESLQSQGAGTQAGSTSGLGEHDDKHGDRGWFGKGATGKYCQGHDSGGGGGGGWYGGGSGGFGSTNYVSSGGGGSGWTFTKSSMEVWEKGDPSKASNFALDGQYYLKDAVCIGGDQEFPRKDGNGNERGHSGNGFARITPI